MIKIIDNLDKEFLYYKNLLLNSPEITNNFILSPEYCGSSYLFHDHLLKERGFFNKSFIITKNDNPVLIFFCFISGSEKNQFYDLPSTFLYAENNIDENIEKILRDKISNLSESKFLYSEEINKNNLDVVSQILLKNKNFSNNCYLSFDQIMKLELSEEQILKKIRSSYRREIKQCTSIIKFYDKKNIEKIIFNKFKNLHHEVSGKKTRSDDSWQLQYETIISGEAFLALIQKDNDYGFIFCNFNKNVCNYFSSVNSNQKNLSMHKGFLETIKLAKKLDIKNFIFGNKIPNIELDSKNENISHFKDGFTTNYLPKITFK